MGCGTSSENKQPYAEYLIIKVEIRLPYNNHPPIFLDFNHRKYSTDLKINSQQMQTISSLLFIEHSELFSRFLKLFESDSSFSFTQISFASLLLCNGSFTEKAKLFFEVLDIKNQNFLTRGEISQLIDELILISIEKIPSLVVESPEIVKKYLEKLRKSSDDCKKLIMWQLLKGQKQISTDTFVDRFLKPKSIDLLTSRGLRKFIYDHSK
jgi:hypothetical protein